MEQINWPISKTVYKNYLLNGTRKAITQHKWNEVLELFPCLLSAVDLKKDSYIIWRVVHCLMTNLNLPTDVQVELLEAFNDHITDSNVMYMEWIFQSFQLPRALIDDTFKIIEKKEKTEKGQFQNLSSLQCFAYYKLHNYYQWRMNLQREGSTDELKKEGLVIYTSLEESYNNLQDYEPNIGKIKKNQYELLSPKSCEWLLAPMLDCKTRLVALKYTKETEEADLMLLNKYIDKAGNHIPALKLCLQYIVSYFPHRKLATAQLLQRICILSPSDPMVLEYVRLFRRKCLTALKQSCKDENTDIDFNSDIDDFADCTDIEIEEHKTYKAKPATNKCLMQGLSVTVTLHCIRTLINMIEYPDWQNNIKPWSYLTSLLNKLYVSWISCYYCRKCYISRLKFRKLLRRLVFWPIHIWRTRLPHNSSHDQAMVTLHRSFSAYVLGYDKAAVRDATKDLNSQGHADVLNQLDNLISFDGEHTLLVRKYLSKNKKNIISKLSPYYDDIQIADKTETFLINIATDEVVKPVVVESKKRISDTVSSSNRKKGKK